MNYYEELGLGGNATGEQIRQQYRSLARLLHPDVHQDEAARQLGDRQMRRLNEIVEILTDPYRRRKYDLSLQGAQPSKAEAPLPPPADNWFRLTPGTFVLSLLLALVLAVLVFGDDVMRRALPPAPPSEASQYGGEAPAAAAQLSAAKESPARGPQGDTGVRSQVTALRMRLRAVEGERDAALLELNRLRAQRDGVPAADSQPEAAAGVVEPPRPASAVEPLPPAPLRQFAGNWLFIRSAEPQPPNMYPPEYIELRVDEEAGTLRGRYRARYHVTDRAISPEVSFQFEGRIGSSGAQARWRNPDGARGELRLVPLADNRMQVDWFATEMGKLGLASGTAVLVRRQP